MKKYLAIFLGSENSTAAAKWEAMDETSRAKKEQEGIAAWGAWVEKNKKFILDMGAPLGVTKAINNKGISDITNKMTAWTVVQAESHKAAAELFSNHPHFTIFPGDSIEVMECLPIPQG